MNLPILIFTILFTFITWRHIHLGIYLFFLLLPTYLIDFHIGPLPTTILEAMFLVIFIVWLAKINKQKIYQLSVIIRHHKSLFIASALFLLGATISIFYATDIRAALGEWKAFYIEPFILFIILITTIQTRFARNTIMGMLIISGLATSIWAIIQHFTGWAVPYDFWENKNTFRVTSWYGFPNAVGLFIAPLVLIILYFFVEQIKKIKYAKVESIKGKRKKYIMPALVLLFTFTFILSTLYAKSTGALIAIIAGIGILLLMYKKTRLIAIIIAISGILTLILLPQGNLIKQELLMQDRSGQMRIDMWAETSALLMKHPIIGAGMASYQEAIYPYRIDKWIEVFHHPHNLFLTMWVNTGLIGLIGFVWIIISILHITIQQYNNRTIKQSPLIFLIASLTTFLVTGLVDSPYIKNDLAMLFWGIIALILITSENKKQLV